MKNAYVDYTWERQRNLRAIFPVIVECPPVHMEYIHPLKQQLVYDVHHALRDDPRICSIVMFGSSTNLRCTIDSDSDFAVRLQEAYICKSVKNEISEVISEICSWNTDILWYDELDQSEPIYDDILKGVQVV